MTTLIISRSMPDLIEQFRCPQPRDADDERKADVGWDFSDGFRVSAVVGVA